MTRCTLPRGTIWKTIFVQIGFLQLPMSAARRGIQMAAPSSTLVALLLATTGKQIQ